MLPEPALDILLIGWIFVGSTDGLLCAGKLALGLHKTDNGCLHALRMG